jgi:nucleotide-binding universal stress UspA family protein
LTGLSRIEALLDGVDVDRVVRFGEPVEETLLEADAFGADLIALAGSRRGRLRSALRPDVVDAVTRRATVPTLVLRQP